LCIIGRSCCPSHPCRCSTSNPCPKTCPAAPQGDPDIAPFFQAVQSGGMAALQSYMANPEFLAKLGNKLGDIDMSLPGEGKPAGGAAAATPSAGAPGAPPPPEIENLLQAAKCVPHSLMCCVPAVETGVSASPRVYTMQMPWSVRSLFIDVLGFRVQSLSSAANVVFQGAACPLMLHAVNNPLPSFRQLRRCATSAGMVTWRRLRTSLRWGTMSTPQTRRSARRCTTPSPTGA